MASVVSVETMQQERHYTATHRVPGPPTVRPIDSVRLIEHLVAEVAHELLCVENTDPRGLIVTVTAEDMPGGNTHYVVSGSLPQSGRVLTGE